MVRKKTQILKSTFISYESGSCRSFISRTSQILENPRNPDDQKRHPIVNRSQIPYLCISSLNSIITKFSENGDLVSAHNLFDQMPDRHAVSWNSMMSAYALNNQPDRVFELFLAMLRDDFKPNPTSFSVALSSCGFESGQTVSRCVCGHFTDHYVCKMQRV
ncbi:pentatricopeptide repeat-containing-like protein [Cinnamomum micranthum f. kanehirae]|uniref:Pentatricopeptide repeat-containing-like protein n=1 Tax=Cinnamomum micranthum f. kanehirae TaxID=337451 RepID=A0A443NIM1_9MAGN|nr:pentatricopeptide repeat-containing-like protein [Cinnamomum micranthum f. kanehirae]